MPSFSTSPSTSARRAPSAMRIASSRARCAMEYETREKSPTAARTSARPANALERPV
ncbi:MAG TPA: hypothetical protein VIZ69_11760 [Thermoanaerobaculia bacterium]